MQEKEDGTTTEDVCLPAYVERSTLFYSVLPLALRLPAYVERRMPEEAGRNRLQNGDDGTRAQAQSGEHPSEARCFPLKVAKENEIKYNRRKREEIGGKRERNGQRTTEI